MNTIEFSDCVITYSLNNATSSENVLAADFIKNASIKEIACIEDVNGASQNQLQAIQEFCKAFSKYVIMVEFNSDKAKKAMQDTDLGARYTALLELKQLEALYLALGFYDVSFFTGEDPQHVCMIYDSPKGREARFNLFAWSSGAFCSTAGQDDLVIFCKAYDQAKLDHALTLMNLLNKTLGPGKISNNIGERISEAAASFGEQRISASKAFG